MLSFPTSCLLPVVETLIKCPLGRLQLKTCTAGVHSLEFQTSDDQKIDLDAVSDFRVTVEKASENLSDPASKVISWLETYFRDPKNLINFCMPRFCFLEIDKSTRSDRFADRVLDELTKIEFGETVSYGELAGRASNEKASRAVGQVMRSNPACLIIPCHRVILKSGGCGHYGGGTKDAIKVWLLKYEADNA